MAERPISQVRLPRRLNQRRGEHCFAGRRDSNPAMIGPEWGRNSGDLCRAGGSTPSPFPFRPDSEYLPGLLTPVGPSTPQYLLVSYYILYLYASCKATRSKSDRDLLLFVSLSALPCFEAIAARGAGFDS